MLGLLIALPFLSEISYFAFNKKRLTSRADPGKDYACSLIPTLFFYYRIFVKIYLITLNKFMLY